MQIIAAGKMCSWERHKILTDKYCDFLAKKPKHKQTWTILHQCEPYNSS